MTMTALSIAAERETAAYKPLSWEQVLAFQVPELDWVVQDLLPRGSATLITAREKSGKGLITLDLCASVALGEEFLGRDVAQGPAIYLAGEENIREIRARLSERIAGVSNVPIFVLLLNGQTEDALRLDDPLSILRFEAMVKEIEPAVVVFDALREFHNNAEDSSDEMAPMLRPWRQLPRTYNFASVFNHHMNKSGSSRGSTAILASFDQGWAFSRTDAIDPDAPITHTTRPTGTLTIEGRFGQRIMEKIELGAHLRWQRQSLPALPPDATAQQKIARFLVSESRWVSAREIAEGTGLLLKSVQNNISAMQRTPQPPFVVRGVGTKGSPREYMTNTPQIIPSYTTDGNHLGTKNHSQEDSQSQGYRVGNKGTIPIAPPIECTNVSCRANGACAAYQRTGVCPLVKASAA